MSLEERGFAYSVLALMTINGWRELAQLPTAADLADCIGCGRDKVARLMPLLSEIPADAMQAQLDKMRRWPARLLAEMTPAKRA
jgi:hypothetical protein